MGFFEVVIPSYSLDVVKSHFWMTRGTLEKLCREVAATGCIPQGICFGGPPISGEDDQLESIEPVSKERKGAKRVSAEFTDYWRQPK